MEVDACNFALIFLLSGVFSIFSIFYSLKSLYPRLTNAGKGLIFWESIRSHKSLDSYLEELGKLDNAKKEIEYGKQNWHISNVLSAKNNNVRLSLLTFGASLIFLIIEYVLVKFS